TGNILKITNNSNATEIDLSGYTNIDDQRVSLSGNVLTLSNGTGADTTVDLSGYLDNTDNQNLTGATIDGNNILTIGIENGDAVTVDLSGFMDNTDNQNLTGATIDGSNILTIGIENGDAVTVDLSGYLDNTDNQELSIVGDQLSIDGGNTVTLPTADGTETKVTAGTNVTVSGDGSIYDPYLVGVASLDDADSDPTNEIQDVASADGSVTITRTVNDFDLSVNFPANNDNSATNELQDLELTSDILTLTNPATGGNQVDLSVYMDNTDNQELSIVGDQLSISGGNTITLNVNDLDAIVGNEVTGATNGTLTRSGSGTTASPYTLAVANGGITENELADNAVTVAKISSGGNNKVLTTGASGTVGWTDRPIASRVFYPPSIAVDASSIGPKDPINLY